MVGLLDALLKNESGGRNIPNTTQGTSSGQAQGYFQITTGTWDDFGGKQYAPNPMAATYEQQAAIASKIPLKRWDESTVALMKATGKTVDPNKTLGENLAANGESFERGSATQTQTPRISGPVEAAGGGAGNEAGGVAAPQLYTPPVTPPPVVAVPVAETPKPYQPEEKDPWSGLASGLASSVRPRTGMVAGGGGDVVLAPPPEFASAAPAVAAAAPMLPAEPIGDLASLFKVGDIGQAAALNLDRMGNPIRRRAYG